MYTLMAFYCEYSWAKLIPYVLLLSLSLFLQTFTLNLNINSKWYEMYVQTSNKHSQVYYVRPKNPFLFSQMRNTLYQALMWRITSWNGDTHHICGIFLVLIFYVWMTKKKSVMYVPLMCCYHLLLALKVQFRAGYKLLLLLLLFLLLLSWLRAGALWWSNSWAWSGYV